MKPKPPIRNRVKFDVDDPMRYLHVKKGERLDNDEGEDSDAVDDWSGDDSSFDRDEVRNRGGVVPPENLA